MNFFKINSEYTINLDKVALVTGSYHNGLLHVYFDSSSDEKSIEVSNPKKVAEALLSVGNFISIKSDWEICILNPDKVSLLVDEQGSPFLDVYVDGDVRNSLKVDKDQKEIIEKGKSFYVEHF